MDKVALWSASDRAALFGETGAAQGLANTIVEKDFWVCWTLKRLFAISSEGGPALVFKGGTSLSKAFGAIRRFSEDIDLSFDRADLGFTGERDPGRADLSRKQASKLLEVLQDDVRRYIRETIYPALRCVISEQLGEPTDRGWTLEIDADDPQAVNFYYPPAFQSGTYAGMDYIKARVRLEFGARGDPWPTERRDIWPYAADAYPASFEEPACSVTVLSARRTFWEKVTAVHAEAHRDPDRPTPQYLSRHYYDIAMLLDTEEGKTAATDFALLAQVASHKKMFFPAAWASYETARPGSLRIIPDETRVKDLRRDYEKMKAMIFDEPTPSFDDILERLTGLQNAINAGHA